MIEDRATPCVRNPTWTTRRPFTLASTALALLVAVLPCLAANADLLVLAPAGAGGTDAMRFAIEREEGEVFYVEPGRVLARIDESSWDLVERLSIDTPALVFPCIGWSPPCSTGTVSAVIIVVPAGGDDFVAALESYGGSVEQEFGVLNGDTGFIVAAPVQALQPLSERPEVVELSIDEGAGLPGPPTLFLGEGWRFRAQAEWHTSTGSGAGLPVQWRTDTGAFFFFRPDNIELTVKVLDGCHISGHYWVFVAGATNVGVSLTVSSATASRSYSNPLGHTFETITDTAALPCD